VTRIGWTVAPVWAAAVLGAVLVGVFAGPAFLTWTAVVLGALVLATAAIQLSLQQKEGFVVRMALSVAGALVILALSAAILAALHPGALPAALRLD